MRRLPILFALASFPAFAQSVQVWLTTDDQQTLMQSQKPVPIRLTPSAGVATIYIDETSAYQQVEGFGASFTDSAAYLMNEVVPAESGPGMMTMLFDHAQGIGVSFVRNPMGASDITRSDYSYDDPANGMPDPNLTAFSIAHDQADIIRLLLQAKAINPSLRVMGTPWSPPGWMKSSNSMIGGSLLPTYDAAFANYLVKYIKAYAAAGIPVDYLSVQNEPEYLPPDYPGMLLSGADEGALLANYVLPALAAAKVNTKVLVYDHNWDDTTYPQTVLSAAQSPLIGGIAWHWYGGPPGAMTTLHNLYPGLDNFVTEASGGTWIADPVKMDFEAIVHSMRNWARSFVKWSLALDENMGPHTGGCGNCRGLIMVNSVSGAVTPQIDYYTLGHFSKFILPGATRVYSTNAPGIIDAAFVNPDGSQVLVAYNDSTASRAFQVSVGSAYFSYTLPALAGATFVWNGSAGVPSTRGGVWSEAAPIWRHSNPHYPAYRIDAKTQLQASSYTGISGLQSESTSDTDGGFDLGYAGPGSWAGYSRIDFGSGVSQVNVRVASAGSGGTLEFHVTSAAGPKIATATIPVTGGWQNWTTVTAPVTVSGPTSTGIHDLFVVYVPTGGQGSVCNLNWFQFQ